MKLMKKIKDLALTWVCITRADSLDAEMLKAMKGSGCREVHIGVESGSDKVLKAMNKQVTAEGLLKGVQLIKDAGIRVKTYLMYNFPGETDEDRKKTVEFIRKAQPDKFTLSRFIPLPGSSIAKEFDSDKVWFYPDEDETFSAFREELRSVLK